THRNRPKCDTPDLRAAIWSHLAPAGLPLYAEPDATFHDGGCDLRQALMLDLGAFLHKHERLSDCAFGLHGDHARRLTDPIRDVFPTRLGAIPHIARATVALEMSLHRSAHHP